MQVRCECTFGVDEAYNYAVIERCFRCEIRKARQDYIDWKIWQAVMCVMAAGVLLIAYWRLA
jgi:hypothetical protein